MPMPIRPAHARSPSEIKAIIEAERAGHPFVLWRDGGGGQRIVSLKDRRRATVGRASSCDLTLTGDGEVSRTHAELELIGAEWAVTDDGLSRNGTFLNGMRISGRRRLADGDVLRCGVTVIEYRHPGRDSTAPTSAASGTPTIESLPDSELKVLIALCRPYKAGPEFALPASNKEIAAEVCLSVDAVKSNLRKLFQRFEIGELPQNQKRARLVERALQWGLVTERDL